MTDLQFGVMIGIVGTYAASTILFVAYWLFMVRTAPIERDEPSEGWTRGPL